MFERVGAEEVLDRVAETCAARDAGLRAAALAVADAVRSDAFHAGAGVRGHAWLRSCTESSRADASRILRLGRLLALHPATREAVEDGRLSVSRADVLAGAVTDGRRASYREHEGVLLDAVMAVERVEDAEVAIGHWCAIVDQELAPTSDVLRQRLVVQLRVDGGSLVVGDLDAPTTVVLSAGLDAFDTGPDPASGPHSPRSLAERRADALGDLARCALDGDTEDGEPARRRERTTNLVIDLPSLAGRTATDLDGIVATRDGRPLAVWAVEQLLCDSWVAALVTDATDAVVDATERTADFTTTQRRLIAARDRHCVFPSCDAPASQCDVHHVHWRSQGGGRELENGVLLCRRHHTFLHRRDGRRRWRLHRNPDGPGWHATSPTGGTWTGRPVREPPPDPEALAA